MNISQVNLHTFASKNSQTERRSKSILPDCVAIVVDVKWLGSSVIELTYKDPSGKLGRGALWVLNA